VAPRRQDFQNHPDSVAGAQHVRPLGMGGDTLRERVVSCIDVAVSQKPRALDAHVDIWEKGRSPPLRHRRWYGRISIPHYDLGTGAFSAF